jgi:hypothetical protein
MKKAISSWHVGIAAEAFAAGLFARCGYDVSVQYGANQQEYDLVVVRGELMLKVSVKGSQDGGWGLTQNFKKGVSYHDAAKTWLHRHKKGTIYCLVQLEGVKINDLPRVYLATPDEIAAQLISSAKGRGETILYEYHEWSKTAAGYGSCDSMPDSWKFSNDRIEELFRKMAV